MRLKFTIKLSIHVKHVSCNLVLFFVMFRYLVFSIFSIGVILKGVVCNSIAITESIPQILISDSPKIVQSENITEKIIVTADCNGSKQELPPLKDFLKSQKIAHRIEYITQQLISNLHIQNPSNGTPNLDALPDFLLQQLIHPTNSNSKDSENLEEIKPRQVVLFPEEETINCIPNAEDILCLRFKLSDELLSAETSSAIIWLNKQHLGIDQDELMTDFIIYELVPWNVRKPANQTLSKQQISDRDDWYQLDLGNVVRNWQMYKEVKQRTIMIRCNTCNLTSKLKDNKNSENIIENSTDKKSMTKNATNANNDINQNANNNNDNNKMVNKRRIPFLLLSTEPEKNARLKRGVDCTPAQQECCREDLFVDVKMLNDDYHMIYYPSRFNAYVCRGNCYYHSFTDVNTPYAGILTLLKNRQPDLSLRTACCTPTKFSNLQVFYASDNSTIEQKIIPNVIVEACGCI